MPLSDKEIKEAEAEHVVRAPVKMKVVVPVQFVPNLIAALQEHWRVFSESYSNVGWNKGGPIHWFQLQSPVKNTDRDAAHPRPARDAASRRRHRAALQERLPAPRRDDALGAVDRSARQHGDARAVQEVSGRDDAGKGDDGRARAADSLDGILPAEIEVARRHGDGAGRRTQRRRPRRHGRAHQSCRASAGRPPTSSSATRSACRGFPSTATCCASATASALPKATIPSRSKSSSARRCRRRDGRGPPTR